jgi:hypothetical protein
VYIVYSDIIDRVSETPRWWLDGVPRYCDFSPERVGVYAMEAALVLVEGQMPEGRFQIGIGGSAFSISGALAAEGGLHLGDPPNYKNIASPHMGVFSLRIIEYWWREHPHRGWGRDHTYERALLDEETLEPLSPNYRRLALEQAGDTWREAVSRRDFSAIRAMLREVGCGEASKAALFVLEESIKDHHEMERFHAWDEYRRLVDDVR